jgi:hypothetical protein
MVNENVPVAGETDWPTPPLSVTEGVFLSPTSPDSFDEQERNMVITHRNNKGKQ